jgi:hypothetical protein
MKPTEPQYNVPLGKLGTWWRMEEQVSHGSTVRLATPLVISQPELEQGRDAVAATLSDLGRRPPRPATDHAAR